MQNNCDKIIMPRQTRKIKPTYRSVSGIHAFRGDHGIAYESTLERDFIIRHEFCKSVLNIIPQPFQIDYRASSGRTYTYTPDFLVQYRLANEYWEDAPKPILVEVKPLSEIKKNWREWSLKYKAAMRFAKNQGYVFHLHDENRIRDQVFKNIMFLKRYKRMEFPKEETDWILENITQMGQTPFHYIVSRHFNGIDAAVGISHIWHLVLMGKLECDMRLPFSNNTELWIPHHE